MRRVSILRAGVLLILGASCNEARVFEDGVSSATSSESVSVVATATEVATESTGTSSHDSPPEELAGKYDMVCEDCNLSFFNEDGEENETLLRKEPPKA